MARIVFEFLLKKYFLFILNMPWLPPSFHNITSKKDVLQRLEPFIYILSTSEYVNNKIILVILVKDSKNEK